jgi:alpha-L-fucosidase
MSSQEEQKAAAAQHAALGIGEQAQGGYRRTQHPDTQWFGNAGLGLFIHWGISSVHGEIDLSWGMMADTPWDAHLHNRNKVTPEEYFKLAERFNPDRYDPDRWLRAAKEAGFRYAVMTTKHHDGFTLWPSAQGEWGVQTYLKGRDLVRPYVEACRKNGLKVGLYYSPPDWYYHRHYMSFHYGSGDEQRFPGRVHYGLRHEPLASLPPKPAGFDEAYRAYVRGHVEELLTRYGQIDLLWFDGGPAVISMEEIRALQPGIVVNNRMHGYGDFFTPECRMPEAPLEGWWELCEIWPEGPWGYVKSESYKSTGWMLSRLAQVRSWGGNYLINVGPRPDGEMPTTYYQRMAELAAWMAHSSESLLDTAPGPFPQQCDVPVTTRGKTWYLHILPEREAPVQLREISRPTSVKALRTGQDLPYAFYGGTLMVDVSGPWRTPLDDVVAVRWD